MTDNFSKNVAEIVIEAMEEKKSENIVILDIATVSSIADYFIIASGNSKAQIQAICDEIDLKLSAENVFRKQMEGYENASWVLMDYGDVIIHVFDKQSREYYDLERIWRDGKKLTPDDLRKSS